MSYRKLKIIMLGESLDKTPGGIAEVQKSILRHVPDSVEIQHISTQEDGSKVRKLTVFTWAVGKFFWNLLLTECDLVHIHVTERASVWRKSLLMLLALVFRKPVILHSHTSEFAYFYSQLPEFAKNFISSWFRQATYFIALSKSWKEFFVTTVKLKPEQVKVLFNPVEFPPEVPERSDKELVNLIFLGRIGQRKGAFDLIEAFASLSLAHQQKSKLIMAGDGEVETARKLVESLNLTDRITVLDWVNSEQRNHLLAKADLFVLPSYNEGLPMALLEAMSWGLAVITTPVGGIPEAVSANETGLLVTPGNIVELSEAIANAIDDGELRLALGNAARTSIAPLDIKNYICSLTNLYYSAAGERLK